MTTQTTANASLSSTSSQSGSMHGGGAASVADGNQLAAQLAVQLLSLNTSVQGSVTQVDLVFSTTMARGAGYVYLTDGAVQTVIDRASGQPVIRVVGATETHKILASELQVSGSHVIAKVPGLTEGHTYNVYMDEGVLTSSALRSFGGLTVPGMAEFTVIDHGGPSVLAMELSTGVLGANAGAELTITFSEPVTELPAGALQAMNATIASLRPVGDGSIWKAALTASNAVSSTGNQVSLDLSQVRDAAGNAGGGTHLSSAYVIDDGALPTATIAMADAELLAGEQVELTITFSEPVAGLGPDALSAPHVTLSGPVTSDGGKTWTLTMAPNTPDLHATDLQLQLDLSKVVDTAGHAGAGSAVSAVYAVDTRVMDDLTGPTLESISFDGHALDASHDIVATIRFSEAVQAEGLLDALDADGAALSNLATSDGGRTWTVKLSTLDAQADPFIGSFDVSMELVRDAAGNIGTGSGESTSFAVNSLASQVFIYDSGVFENDDVVGNVQRYVTGFFFGEFGDPADAFTLTVGDQTIYNGEIDFFQYEGVLFWSYGGEEYWTEGEYDMVASIATSAGGTLQTTKHVSVDTTAPAIVESPSSGSTPTPLDVADGLVVVFDEAVYFSSGAPKLDLEITVGGIVSEVEIALSDAYLSADRKTLSIPANDHHLPPGATIAMWLPGLEDRAGNRVSAEGIFFETTGVFLDTEAPVAVRADAQWLGATTVGGEVDFSISFNETVSLTGDGSYFVNMNNGGQAEFLGLDANGRELHFRYTVDAGDGEIAKLGVADLGDLAGNVKDAFDNFLDSASVDFAVFGDVYGNFIEVDKTAPGALPVPGLAVESNTGALNDAITRVNAPIIRGSGAEPNAVVRIKIDGIDNDDLAYVDDNGDWEWEVPSSLDAGAHTLQFRQEDEVGLSSGEVALSLTIEAFGAPTLAASSDSGISDSDGITRDDTPTYSGAGAIGGHTIKLFANGVEVGESTARADGTWDITVGAGSALADGVYVITAKEVDGSGRQTDASGPTALVIDTAAPTSSSAVPSGANHTYSLSFNEKIVFAPGGKVDMVQNDELKTWFSASGSGWSKPQDNQLLFSMNALNGLFKMQLSANAIQDVAGNVAIIGSAHLEFDLGFSI